MNRSENIRQLKPGRILSPAEMKGFLGSVPPQSEFSFELPTRCGTDRKAFRRYRVEGREAWEVVQ